MPENSTLGSSHSLCQKVEDAVRKERDAAALVVAIGGVQR